VSEKMRALVIKGPMQYDIENVEIPVCPDRGILLKVLACGLCGSDLRTIKSGHKNIKFPWIIGHEISGIVVETGCDYHGKWKIGDLLAVAPVVYCGTCDFCLAGKYELCENIREIAQTWPGGFAEYVAIPEEALALGTVQSVPEGLDPVIAAIAEPLSSCVNAQEKARIGLGDSVMIIGSGPIGCFHIALARARGAGTIIIADVFDERLELCKSFGPDITINASKVDLVEEVMKITNGKGVDVVITANPVGETQVQAIKMAKKGGRVVLFGGLPHGKSKPEIDTNIIHYRAIHLMGTTTFAPNHHKLALSLMANGRIPGDKMVTHRMPLSDFEKGLQLAINGKALKVVFIP